MSSSEHLLKSKYELSETKYQNVSQYLLDYLLIHKHKQLIIDFTNSIAINGQKIYDLSQVIANALINDFQLKTGDIVCFFCANSYLQTIAPISVWSAGGVCLFINEKTSYDEIEDIFIKTKFNYLFCGQNNENIATKLINKFSEIKKTFIIADESHETENNFVNINQLLINRKNEEKRICIQRCPSDLALIELTGGTTDGNRKPVIKTHSNLIYSIIQIQNTDILSNNIEDVIISVTFDKIFGISFFLNSLISGSISVINEGTFETNSTSYLNSIEKLKVSKLILFSTDVELMVKNEVNLMFDISSVKEIIYLGVFEDYNQIRLRVENMFKCRYFRCVYGTTESGVISCLYRSKSYERNSYSVGQLIPGTELKIIDISSGETLSAHRLGEICVKSKQLSPRYLTESSTDSYTSDGYFKTNDFGYFDSEANLYIESKVSDIVFTEDQVYSPNELVILLESHPNVKDVSVVGTYCYYSDDETDNESDEDNPKNKTNNKNNSKELNNTFKIFVVLKPGSNITDLDLINFINDRVEPIKQIDSGLFIVDVLPRNSMRVIRRSALIKYCH